MEVSIRLADVITVAIYLSAMIVVGFYFAKRNKTTEEYFVGNRSFSGWVIGLSMLGTIISSATFLALPAAAFILDWRQLVVNLVVPFVAILAVVIFIPFFRRGKLTSAFEYLGERYGKAPRLYGTVSFIILQLFRLTQVLFLASIVVQFLTGIPILWVIIFLGTFIGFYTVFGGIEAVIWTDVVQALILLLGGVMAIIWMTIQIPGGLPQIISTGFEFNKFSLGEFDFDLAERTFYTVIILGLVQWLGIYAGDQNLVQRYVAAKSTKEAQKATIVYTVIALPMWIMFFFIGTSLFVFYFNYPSDIVAVLDADQVFPFFILTEMPPIVSGIIISAVIAATMSTMDSGINSIATVSIVDIIRPYLAKNKPDEYYLKLAKLLALCVTVIGIIGAIMFSNLEKESMNHLSLIISSVFGGCLMGLFIIGFFTERVDGFSATIGMSVAVLFNIYLGLSLLSVIPESLRVPIHSYWVGALVNMVFFTVAYSISLFRKPQRKDLTDLTVWTKSAKSTTR